MHRTGDFVLLPNDFSTANWDPSTQAFLDIIEKDLTNDDWRGIFEALYTLSTSRTRKARVKAGAPAEHQQNRSAAVTLRRALNFLRSSVVL